MKRVMYLLIGLGAGAALIYWVESRWSRPTGQPPVNLPAEPPAEASAEVVQTFCGSCHPNPPAETFPRSAWRREVVQAYRFYDAATPDFKAKYPAPPIETVIRSFERRAPERLALPTEVLATTPPRVTLTATPWTGPAAHGPGLSHLNLAPLIDPKIPDLIACDMLSGEVARVRLTETPWTWQTLAKLENPAHAEVVDLDKDGRRDLLVADLGQARPSDLLAGKVVWLRQNTPGQFTPVTLLEGVGRIADVQAADFDGDGDLDLVVAIFGWRKAGQIVWLENQTTDWAKPTFVSHLVDSRHGAIHVPVADLNGDGKPDFVALISQEHETIVAFLNQGQGKFKPEVIDTAPHPAYGSSGIQIVDLNGDGKLDVLASNGDTMDSNEMKPYHGIRWLENKGSFPFTRHQLATMPGAHRAVAADFDGDGDLDIVAVAAAPPDVERPTGRPLASVVYLEQSRKGEFQYHELETDRLTHLTCVAGDWKGDGVMRFVVGNFELDATSRKGGPWFTVWDRALKTASR